jgi:hypothetical protein
MPNPGKPAELKRKLGAKGYTGVSTAVALPMVSDVPEPPRELGDAGLELWNRTWLSGFTWLSVNTDIHLLAMTCEQLDERVGLRELVLSSPDSWRERAALRELEKAIRSNLSLLGFTPTDRMKLGIAEVKTKSKLAEFMEKHG